jgi:EmrB/QacA subfamily drug resistance transporter
LRSSQLTPLIVASALLMENLDGTVIATSLPAIATDIHQNPLALKLALTSYLLALAIFIPISGWMADRFGAKRIFRTAIVIFTFGSILCGLSNSLTGFVLARFLQGFGGSMMTPVGRLVVLRTARREELVQAFAWLTMPAMAGPMLGPPLGGFITTYFNWRWIFFINVPISVVGLILTTIYIQEFREEAPPPLDWRGFILSGLGLSGVVFGCAVAGLGSFSNAETAGLIVGGLALLGLYLLHARKAPHPLLDLSLMRIPSFRASVTGGTLFRCAAGAAPFVLPLMLQLGFGLSAFESGIMTFANAAGAFVMKFTAPRVLRKYGFRSSMLWNGVICAFFFALNAYFYVGMPLEVMFAILLVSGFFRSLEFTGLNALGYCEINREQMSSATSFGSTAQQVSQALGVAIGAGAIEASRAWRGGGPLTMTDFRTAFLVMGAFAAVSLISYWRLSPDTGALAVGRKPSARARETTAPAAEPAAAAGE